MKARITKRLLDDLLRDTRRGRLEVRDTELPGFLADVRPSGITFALDYRLHGKRERGETIGRFGVLTLDQARQAARVRLAEVELARGQSPAPEPEPPATVKTWGELLDAFLEWAPRKRPGSINEDRRRIERHLRNGPPKARPPWHERPHTAVTRADLFKLHDAIEAPIEANRVLELARRVWTSAMATGVLPWGPHPAHRLGEIKNDEPEKHDRSATALEVRNLRDALIEPPPRKPGAPSWQRNLAPSWQFRAMIWLVLLTALRRDEASGLEWARINLGDEPRQLPGRHKLPGRAFYLAPDQTKPGRPTVLPLSLAACELLLSLPSRPEVGDSPSPWLFPGRGSRDGTPGPLRYIQRPWERARARAGCPELTVHDLRATVATWLDRANVRERVIDAILNHAPADRLRRRYVGDPPLEDLRAALDDHGRRILEAAEVDSAAALIWGGCAEGRVIQHDFVATKSR